jgi:hypothetical protein
VSLDKCLKFESITTKGYIILMCIPGGIPVVDTVEGPVNTGQAGKQVASFETHFLDLLSNVEAPEQVK